MRAIQTEVIKGGKEDTLRPSPLEDLKLKTEKTTEKAATFQALAKKEVRRPMLPLLLWWLIGLELGGGLRARLLWLGNEAGTTRQAKELTRPNGATLAIDRRATEVTVTRQANEHLLLLLVGILVPLLLRK